MVCILKILNWMWFVKRLCGSGTNDRKDWYCFFLRIYASDWIEVIPFSSRDTRMYHLHHTHTFVRVFRSIITCVHIALYSSSKRRFATLREPMLVYIVLRSTIYVDVYCVSMPHAYIVKCSVTHFEWHTNGTHANTNRTYMYIWTQLAAILRAQNDIGIRNPYIRVCAAYIYAAMYEWTNI